MNKPRTIPEEPGCLVQRITEPTNNFEAQCLATHITIWRVTLWIGGVMYTTTRCSTNVPELADNLDAFRAIPIAWETAKTIQP